MLMEKLASNQLPSEESESADKEGGPKTANMPETTEYTSADLWKLLDVGSLPGNLKETAWTMLNWHIKVFRFDGQLGDYSVKVRIRTVEGSSPISLPMYSSLPAKREFIDQQIDMWFSKGIIEPSRSPWGAPIVIAYHNDKSQFCVDYWRLNAITIPDEFLIPQQTDTLAVLAGSQVLSSSDMLTGFTQLQLHKEDMEKIAF